MALFYEVRCIETDANDAPIRARKLLVPATSSYAIDDNPEYNNQRSISRVFSLAGVPYTADKFVTEDAQPGILYPRVESAINLAGVPGTVTRCERLNTPQVRKFIIDSSTDMYIKETVRAGTYSSNSVSFYVDYEFWKNGTLYQSYPAGPISNGYSSGNGSLQIAGIPFPSLLEEKLLFVSATAGFSYNSTDNAWYCTTAQGGVSGTTSAWDSYYHWLNDVKPYEPVVYDTENPYENGGFSGETGDTPGIGDYTPGNFSDQSDTPEADALPTISAVDTGFATIFTPSRSQLRALSALFWNSNVFTFLQNLVENITDMFVSLAMVPFNVAAGATVSVTWLGIDTAVSLTLAAQQFYEFNMGTINLGDDLRAFTSGSALDYSPFSSLGIYLPFVGYREMDIDECRGASINLRYRVDILSGACVAIIKVGGRDIYEFTGNCLTQIPITNETMQSLVSDAINVGIALSNATAASGAATADMAAAENASSSELGDARRAHAQSHLTQSRGQLASATANAAMGIKPNFAKTGSVGGADAMMAVKQPYLFLKTPRQAIPEYYEKYCGFPSNISGRLSEFSGYTVVEDIRLNNLVATSPEVAEIYELLKKGVII